MGVFQKVKNDRDGAERQLRVASGRDPFLAGVVDYDSYQTRPFYLERQQRTFEVYQRAERLNANLLNLKIGKRSYLSSGRKGFEGGLAALRRFDFGDLLSRRDLDNLQARIESRKAGSTFPDDLRTNEGRNVAASLFVFSSLRRIWPPLPADVRLTRMRLLVLPLEGTPFSLPHGGVDGEVVEGLRTCRPAPRRAAFAPRYRRAVSGESYRVSTLTATRANFPTPRSDSFSLRRQTMVVLLR